MQLTGILKHILPEQTGEGSNGTWKKISFVIETGDQYPKTICLDAWGDRVETVKGLQLGMTVTSDIDIESREFNSKWYTNVKAWKIEGSGSGNAPVVGSEPLTESPEDDSPPF